MTFTTMDCFNCGETTAVESIHYDRNNTAEHKTAILKCSICKKESILQ